MFAASVFDTYKSYKAHELSGAGQQIIIDTAIGFVVSMVVAFFVVKWLLRFVQSHTFNGFAIYRVILGGGLLIGLYTHAIPDVTNEQAKTVAVPAPAAAVSVAQPEPAPAPILPPTPAPEPMTNAPLPVAPAVDQSSPVPTANAGEPPRAMPVDPADLTNTAPETNPPPANVPAPQN